MLKVNDSYFNPEKIIRVEDDGDLIHIWFLGETRPYSIEGERADAFRKWLEKVGSSPDAQDVMWVV